MSWMEIKAIRDQHYIYFVRCFCPINVLAETSHRIETSGGGGVRPDQMVGNLGACLQSLAQEVLAGRVQGKLKCRGH